jgi:hypothetical protein
MTNWTRGRIAFLYSASLLPGIFSLAESIGIYASSQWMERLGVINIYPWAYIGSVPKIQSLVEYTSLLVMIGILIGTAFITLGQGSRVVSLTRPQSTALWIYLLLCLVIPSFMPSPIVGSLWMMLAGVLPALAATRFLQSRPVLAIACSRLGTALPLLGGVVLAGLLVFLYATAWNSNLRFQNDSRDLPEYTLMSERGWVENNTFLQENRVLGRAELDPCRGDIVDGLCVDLPRTVFRSPREALGFFQSGSGLHYSWEEQKLRAYRNLTVNECLLINALLTTSEINCPHLVNKTQQSLPHHYGLHWAEFLNKNRMEIVAQENLGRFFFHHAYLYLPVLQVISGVDSGALLPMQYGVGLTQVFAQLLRWGGSHAFQDYYQLYWIGPGLYVVLAALVAFALTRSTLLAVAVAVMIIGLLPFHSIDALRMVPGFNPWRHLPDLICFLAIGLHVARPSIFTVLLRAVSIALLLWWNREFGLFMLAGSAVWHLLTIAQTQARFSSVAACAVAELAACSLVMIHLLDASGSNELAFYNLLGVGMPITRWSEVIGFCALWLVLLGWVAWVRFRPAQQNATPCLEVAGVGLSYAAIASVYATWNPPLGYYSVIWICASLPVICFVQWGVAAAGKMLQLSPRWVRSYFVITLSAIVLPSSVVAAVQGEAVFEQMFKYHRTFQWSLPGINGQTTANPAPIEEAVRLMQREQPEGAVLLISRHDVLLHTATGRLSMLPYVDLPSAVIGWRMIDSIAARVAEKSPPVIFMDRDMFASREWQLLDITVEKDRAKANYNRIGHLAALAMLAREVSQCYEPGPVGGVLQAWRRHCP